MIFLNGFSTGLLLQFAIGPVFFYIMNISIQRTTVDGLFSVLAVTLADYCYIFLAIAGIGKFLEGIKREKAVGIVSGVVLVFFGILIILSSQNTFASQSQSLLTQSNYLYSFISAFILTISSPLTIVFWMGLFATKTIESNYTTKELVIFGLAAGLATLVFLSLSIILISLFKNAIPDFVIRPVNICVGIVLICYGAIRMIKSLQQVSIR